MIVKHKIFIILVTLIIPLSISAQTSRYEVESLMLGKFTKFIEWPNHNEENELEKPFKLCVFGNNPINNYLRKYLEYQLLKSRKVKIKIINTVSEITDCNLLFIGKVSDSLLDSIIAYTKDKPILTIADTEGYASKGVIINMFLKNGRIRFEVNIKAKEKSGLYISSMLLNLAKIIDGGHNESY